MIGTVGGPDVERISPQIFTYENIVQPSFSECCGKLFDERIDLRILNWPLLLISVDQMCTENV